jgi:hypothetical protein
MDNQHRKIKGYRDLSEEEIALINEIKTKQEEIGLLVDRIGSTQGTDMRWTSIARTGLQQGFMALTRAVAKPDGF